MSEQPTQRRVMIGTPTIDGRVSAWYLDAVVKTILRAQADNIVVQPVFVAYDSMIQRARNDLVAIALALDVDDLVFIDSDEAWMPEDFMRLLSHQVDLVGGTARKKTDTELYVLKIPDDAKLPLSLTPEGLLKVDAIGTGFARLTKACIKALWDASPLYYEERNGKMEERRRIFDIEIDEERKELVSEDTFMCKKWRSLGGEVYLDPRITVAHFGEKAFLGNFFSWAIANNFITV